MASSSPLPSAVPDAPKGVLVLVVGPSGAGKDTLMEAARARLGHCRFARRLITRPAMIGAEDHDSCSPSAFEAAVACGEIALHWQAHGLSYGIPAQALAGVGQGEVVVANVSRGVIAQAERLGARVVVVNITAPPDVLAKRLSLRGRESEADIAARLARDAPLRTQSAELVTICNDRTVGEGAAELVDIIAALSPHRTLSSG